MINQGYPKLNLYTKKQLANAIRDKDLSFSNAMELIENCLANKDKYWFDNQEESKRFWNAVRKTTKKNKSANFGEIR